VNLIGGILKDSDTYSLSGYPWISKIPILKYLFSQESKERDQSEIIFAITPHIIRGGEVTDDNLRIVDLGSANSVTYRKVDSKADAAKPTTPPPASQPAERPVPGPPAANVPPQPVTKPPVQPIGGSGELVKPALDLRPAPTKSPGAVKPALGG
jgi:general secretion pathway protein D